MKIARRIARLLCSIAIVIVGVYSALAMIVAVFIANGALVPDGVLFYDSPTPTLAHALQFVGVGSLVLTVCAVARHRLTEEPSQEAAPSSGSRA